MNVMVRMIKPALFGHQDMGTILTILCACAALYLILFLLLLKRMVYSEMETENDTERSDLTVLIDEQEGAVSDHILGISSVLGTRAYQQDRAGGCAFPLDGETALLGVVCDGMGGMENGDRASEHCCMRLVQQCFCEANSDRVLPDWLIDCVKQLDEEVSSFEDKEGNKIESGTTLVAACLHRDELYWCSVGDSRIYLFEENRLTQLTRDHNYALKLEKMVAAGKISREKAEATPRKDALISYIGMGNVSLIDVNRSSVKVRKSGIVLLCSDGVTKLLSDAQICEILRCNAEKTAAEIAVAVTSAATANRRKSQDNTSAVVLKQDRIDKEQ